MTNEKVLFFSFTELRMLGWEQVIPTGFLNLTLYKDDIKHHHSDFWNLSEIIFKK
jgi:hypothetical protein